MKKSGFIFAETIIVISILAITLLIVYRAFSNTINLEKRRLNQDNAVYLYRTYNIAKFYQRSGIDTFINNLDDNNKIFVPLNCEEFNVGATKKTFCEKLIHKPAGILHIENIYLMKNDISALFEPQNATELRKFSSGAIEFLKTQTDTQNGYRLFVEFKVNCRTNALNKDGSQEIENCDWYYASVKVRGVEQS